MPGPRDIERQVNGLISHLVELGLAGDQNFAFQRVLAAGVVEVTFQSAEHLSSALRDRAYREVYARLAGERAYNLRMPDGAIIQMLYRFCGGALERHRLAFFPSPDLGEFQSTPDVYLEDALYADVVGRQIVPFPVRFDYDGREGIHREVFHPKSHLTLGQYRNCRIPVTAPLTPFWFLDFVLRSFYETNEEKYTDRLPRFEDVFIETIRPTERRVIHIGVPNRREPVLATRRRAKPGKKA